MNINEEGYTYEIRFYIGRSAIPCTVTAKTEEDAIRIFRERHKNELIKSIKKRKPIFEGVVKTIP